MSSQDSTIPPPEEPAHAIQTDMNQPPPPSAVADYDYPNVPDTTEPQQGLYLTHFLFIMVS